MTSSFISTTKNAYKSKIGCFEALEHIRKFIRNKKYVQIPQLCSSKYFDEDI